MAWKMRTAPAYVTEEWRWLFDTITGQTDKLMGRVGAGVYAAAASMVFNLFNLILAPILVFFMLFYKRDIQEGIAAWLPEKHRGTILELGREINKSVGGYIRGQLVVSAIVAV